MSNFPNGLDSLPANIQGNTQLSDPTYSHNAMHNNANSAINAIEGVIGTNNGSSILGGFTANQQALPVQNGTLGTAISGTFTALNGGTLMGQIQNNGTLTNGFYGSATFQGGTANNQVLGTPTVQAGSFNLPIQTSPIQTLSTISGTLGTVNINNGNIFPLTQSGTTTLTIANAQAGQFFIVEASGTYPINFWSGINWVIPGGSQPAQTSVSGGITTYGFRTISSGSFNGYLVASN